jgi:hypothetical protein
MLFKSQASTVYLLAIDTSTGGPKTGLSDLTVSISKDGGSNAGVSASASEAGNGLYSVALSSSETAADVLAVSAVSATSGVAISPLICHTTGGSVPAAAPGASGGLPTVDASNRIAGIQGTITDLDGLPTAAAITDAVWDEATSGHTSSGTYGKAIGDGVTSWVTATGFNTTTPPTVEAIADQVWDEAQSGHTTSGTFGYYLDAQVSSAAAPPTAAAIADAVWDEATSGHTSSGTYGKAIGDGVTSWVTASGFSVFDASTDSVSVSSVTSSAANTIADGLLDRADGVEPASGGTERTVREALRIILSSSAGKVSGADSSTITFRDLNDSLNRIVATVDENGNRSALTYNDA